jgi:hypothetical protein
MNPPPWPQAGNRPKSRQRAGLPVIKDLIRTPASRHRRGGSSSGGHVGGEDVIGVAVEVLPSSVVSHGGAGVGVAGGDLDVAQIDAGVEHGSDERGGACTGAP